MNLKQKLKAIGERVISLTSEIKTEEATKNVSIMPFIQALGYDVFNPLEVVPEYITDIGTKKGEKIDYAILQEGKPIILIECKHIDKELDLHDGQLLRYFHVSNAKFAILTNGIIFRFYSDLERDNIMDSKPFLEFDITDLKDSKIDEISKFQKNIFNIDTILNSASDLKDFNAVKNELATLLTNPSEDFIKIIAKKVHSGIITSKVCEKFSAHVRKAIDIYIGDKVTDRLKSALEQEDEIQDDLEIVDKESKIVTTQDELDGFNIVRAILCKYVEVKRVAYRDAQSYFAILLDDNNRKTICRLYLDGKKKQIGIFDENKDEIKFIIDALEDIYNHEMKLQSIITHLLGS